MMPHTMMHAATEHATVEHELTEHARTEFSLPSPRGSVAMSITRLAELTEARRARRFRELEIAIPLLERELRVRTWDIPIRDLVPRLVAAEAEARRRELFAECARSASERRRRLALACP